MAVTNLPSCTCECIVSSYQGTFWKFYKQIEKECTLDDCCVRMQYTLYQGEKSRLRIDVCDNTYIKNSKH